MIMIMIMLMVMITVTILTHNLIQIIAQYKTSISECKYLLKLSANQTCQIYKKI